MPRGLWPQPEIHIFFPISNLKKKMCPVNFYAVVQPLSFYNHNFFLKIIRPGNVLDCAPTVAYGAFFVCRHKKKMILKVPIDFICVYRNQHYKFFSHAQPLIRIRSDKKKLFLSFQNRTVHSIRKYLKCLVQW